MSIPVNDDEPASTAEDYDSINPQPFAWESLQFAKLSAEEIDELVPNDFVIETAGGTAPPMNAHDMVPTTISPDILAAAQQQLPTYDHHPNASQGPPIQMNHHQFQQMHQMQQMQQMQQMHQMHQMQQMQQMQQMNHYLPQFPMPNRQANGKKSQQKEITKPPRKVSPGVDSPMCMVCDDVRLNGNHTPCVTPKDPHSRSEMRGHCVSCDDKTKTITRCVECNIFLHIKGDGIENCWYRFHTMKDHYRKVTNT
jgi:hypothetical protein